MSFARAGALAFVAVLLSTACQAGVPTADLERAQAELKASQAQLQASQADLAKQREQTATLKAALDPATKPFNEWSKDWKQRAKPGSLKATFAVKTLTTYEAKGAPLFEAKPGGLYVYANTGNQNWPPVGPLQTNTNKYSRVNVIDAQTKKLVATREMTDAVGFSHFSAVTPDGRFAYVSGGGSFSEPEKSVVWKVDARTLEPAKKIQVGGTVHHMQVFRDRFMLVSTFSTVPGAPSIFLLDSATDEMVGGVRADDLGGGTYLAFQDPQEKFIYVLMEPKGSPGFAGLMQGTMGQGVFWIAKIDPDTWTVVREYPYPGWRSDWIQFGADGKSMYVDGYLDDTVSKIELESGKLVWRTDTGTGPYGIELTADGKEVWVTDKGEASKNHKGRTITVIDEKTGTYKDTIPQGRGTDHLTLSPDGKEMWASSNDNGEVNVFDVSTKKLIATIPMPLLGDAHGVVFVSYGADGKSRVVADLGDFHGGVDPRNSRPLAAGR